MTYSDSQVIPGGTKIALWVEDISNHRHFGFSPDWFSQHAKLIISVVLNIGIMRE